MQKHIVRVLVGTPDMGLAAIKVVPDPLSRLYARHPRAQLVIMGGLIGGFLIGRPFPLFFKLFQYAAESQNAFLGAGTFILQALGNIVALLIAGTFTFTYRVLRVPSLFGYGWWPTAPWWV